MKIFAFDLDNTLYDRNKPIRTAFENTALASVISFEAFQPVYSRFSDRAFDALTRGELSLNESQLMRIRETAAYFGHHPAPAELEGFQLHYEKAKEKLQLFDFFPPLLDQLKERHCRLMLITNGPTLNQQQKIRQLGLEKWFAPADCFISEAAGTAKPDPAFFQLAEEAASITDLEKWYIGDSFEYDVIGSLNAGWQAIWFNHQRVSPADPSNYQGRFLEVTTGEDLTERLTSLL